MKVHQADIAIVGAGPNGLATALALGGSRIARPLRVIVIDPVDPFVRASKPDSRASALTRATQAMFEALGMDEELRSNIQDMRTISVTDDALGSVERPSLLSFATDENSQAAAAMVENHIVLQALLKAMATSPEITGIFGTAVSAFSFGPGPAVLTLANGELVKAQLIIAADGRHSRAREASGITCDLHDYQQTAITLTISHEKPHRAHAQEHFTPSGVFAVLPLTGNRSSIVWTERTEKALHLKSLGPEELLLELASRTGASLGKIAIESEPAFYPLAALQAQQFVAPRLALVGDAAHVVHPLAGLGLNLGFKDAAALAEVVSDAAAIGEDIGSLNVLERYQRARRFDTTATMALIDGMNRLFANDNPALKLVRDAGLRLVNKVPFAKTMLMQQAAGTEGDLPRLMRGIV